MTRSGVAKLADLGLAKRTDETSHLTAARQGFGTPHYMPYEQAINAKQADRPQRHLRPGRDPLPSRDRRRAVLRRQPSGGRREEGTRAVPAGQRSQFRGAAHPRRDHQQNDGARSARSLSDSQRSDYRPGALPPGVAGVELRRSRSGDAGSRRAKISGVLGRADAAGHGRCHPGRTHRGVVPTVSRGGRHLAEAARDDATDRQALRRIRPAGQRGGGPRGSQRRLPPARRLCGVPRRRPANDTASAAQAGRGRDGG